ncbi:MAG: hypothetical protein ABEJ56_06345 [Candidatus Nanohaloarchaea archaeon]
MQEYNDFRFDALQRLIFPVAAEEGIGDIDRYGRGGELFRQSYDNIRRTFERVDPAITGDAAPDPDEFERYRQLGEIPENQLKSVYSSLRVIHDFQGMEDYSELEYVSESESLKELAQCVREELEKRQ